MSDKEHLSLFKAIKRHRAERTPVNTGGLEPTANKVRGQSGSSGDNTYKNVTRAVDFTIFKGAEIADGTQKRRPAIKAIKDAQGRLDKKTLKKKIKVGAYSF